MSYYILFITLKGFRSFGSRWILPNTSKYSMSAELPLSTRTLLFSRSSHLTVMTMESPLWGWVSATSFFEKAVVVSSVWHLPSISTSVRFSTLKIWRAYLLGENMEQRNGLEGVNKLLLKIDGFSKKRISWVFQNVQKA